MAGKYSVYSLSDESGVPFWIGATTDHKIRLASHIVEAKSCEGNDCKNTIIKRMAEASLTPVITILAVNLSKEEAWMLEKQLIEKIGRKELGGTLVNRSGGGAGGNDVPSLRDRRRLSGILQHLKNPRAKLERHRLNVWFSNPQIEFLIEESSRIGISIADLIRRIIDQHREGKPQ